MDNIETVDEITNEDVTIMMKLLSEYASMEKNRSGEIKQFPQFHSYFAHKAPESAARYESSNKRDQARREELALWKPTKDDIKEVIKEKGWPDFSHITYDHIDDKKERETLETAVSTVKEFVEDSNDGTHPVSMIILANPIEGDMDRTGYGCGKTTLAQIAYYSNLNVIYAKGSPGSIQVNPVGRFYSSREVMALFDSESFNDRYTFQSMGKVVVIDDLGREGTLKWEKRDLDMQLQEKQDRYYSLINYCYSKGINLIITSNLTSREMATFLGGASWSRLLQMVPKKYRVNMTGIRDMRPLLAEQEWF